ncbi:MAG TPA: acyltransferase family protein [Bryobacteraceae bacterium]|nr:acyltransferase family protein [Bryobacteraceae bacterium]
MNSSGRYDAIDALRGTIMILMAIDHASGLIARQHASEFWAGAMSAYDSAFPFLTRLVTHPCAPGFFFLMGAGIYWYAAKYIEDGKSTAPAVRRVLLRGVIIFVLAQAIEMPLVVLNGALPRADVSLNRITAPPPNDGSAPVWFFVTLAGLGLVMIVCALLLRLRPWMWLAVAALCTVVTHSMLPVSGRPGPWWATLMLTAGMSDGIVVVYPVIPWLAVAASGMYFGYWWRRNPESASRRVWLVGAALVALALTLRATGAWGNIRLPRDSGWIEFLNNVKYPPSLVFWTLAVGFDLVLLAVLARLPHAVTSSRSPLIVFGQAPLFFYVMHFLVLTACAFLFFRTPASLEGAWLVWLLVVVALYPLCAWYRTFKLAKPMDSLWRMF